MNPRVSVIMPIYNSERYIEQAISSILRQSFTEFELLLINDHPTDNTMDIVEGICDDRIRIIDNNGNYGIAYSRNRGIEKARGEYIALMDDDDMASLDRLEIEVNFLDYHKEIGAIGAGMQTINSEGLPLTSARVTTLHNPMFIKAYLLFYNCIANGTVLFRKEIVDKYGIRYMDNYMGMEDYRFWLDFSQHALITNIDDILLYWRISDVSETQRVKEENKEERAKIYGDILKHALELNRFELTDLELELYLSTFTETEPQIIGGEELIAIYRILRKMIDQAIANKKENAKEIMQVCRKLYIRLIQKSTIWEIDTCKKGICDK